MRAPATTTQDRSATNRGATNPALWLISKELTRTTGACRARPGAPYLEGQLLIVKASLSQSLHERRTRGAAQRPPQHNSSPRRHRADSAPPTMEAKGSEDETKDAKEEEPPSKVVIDLLNFAMRVVHEEMSGFFEQPDRGVPRCRGAFTPSRRVVSLRAGRGWSLF